MASQLVQQKIAGKKVMVFSKTTCSFCGKAKRVLKKYLDSGELSADDYEVLEIDNRSDCGDLQNELKKITGARSVPRVFINGKCIGGGDETESLDRSGKLKALLAA